VEIARMADLGALMRSQIDTCVIVDPVLLSAEEARSLATSATSLLRPIVVYTTLTPEAIPSAVILASQTKAQFVFQGTPDERSALVHALLTIPAPEFGSALITAISPQLWRLPPRLRSVATAMLRTGLYPPDSVGLALTSGLPRRTMDRAVINAGFRSTRLLIAAAKLIRTYRAITDSNSSLRRIAIATGYASQRTLDQQCSKLLGTNCATLRRIPLSIPSAVDILVSRLVKTT
jgi:hypothetical protein